MKLSFIAVAFKAALLSLALAMPFLASAQGAIERATEPYMVKPDIRFVIASAEVKPTEAIMAAAAPVVVIPPSWTVKTGSLLRESLQEWTTKAGWSFFWGLSDQDDFRLGSGNSYGDDFKIAVIDLINSLPATVRIRVELRTDNVPPLLYVTTEEGTR